MPSVVSGNLVGHREDQQNTGEFDSDKETHLFKIYGMSQAGEIDRAIDYLFDHFEDLFEAGRFEECDRILRDVDLERLDTTLMVSYLAITLCVKEQVPSRATYFARVKTMLVKQRGEEQTERLLRGLG